MIAAVTFAGEEAKGAMKVQGPSKWSRKVVEWDKKRHITRLRKRKEKFQPNGHLLCPGLLS